MNQDDIYKALNESPEYESIEDALIELEMTFEGLDFGKRGLPQWGNEVNHG
jgi:hypothetical protein